MRTSALLTVAALFGISYSAHAAPCSYDPQANNPLKDIILCLVTELDATQQQLAAAEARIATMQSQIDQNEIALLQHGDALDEHAIDIAANADAIVRLPVVDDLDRYVSVDPSTDAVVFTGANVFVRSRSGATDGAVDGTGNLVLGHDANCEGEDKSGSHNLVMGVCSSYSSYGGIVGGKSNGISGPFASAIAGSDNHVSGERSVALGGGYNQVTATQAAAVGGENLLVDSTAAFGAALGGDGNQLVGTHTVAAAGQGNLVQGSLSAVYGGLENTAVAPMSTIVNGIRNQTHGTHGVVLSGEISRAIGDQSVVLSGWANYAEGPESVIVTGHNNNTLADAEWAVLVSGWWTDLESAFQVHIPSP